MWVYISLCCVLQACQVIVYLYGNYKTRYMSEVVNAVQSYCNLMVDQPSKFSGQWG